MEVFDKDELVNEFLDIEKRHDKLIDFINSDDTYKNLDPFNKMLLDQQHIFMAGYRTALCHRLAVILNGDEIQQYIKNTSENEIV